LWCAAGAGLLMFGYEWLQSDLKVPLVFNGNLRDENTPVHKAVREAMINMVTNADFHGRRGVVVNKDADGFKFANPGTMRVSLADAIRFNSSDPRNGTMLKMLALVEYGERAGSGLHRIFHTWETVYNCTPKMEVTASGGVDRTVLRLDFEGHKPDIEAMRTLYDHPEQIRFEGEVSGSTQESTTEATKSTQETSLSTQEKSNGTQECTQEKIKALLRGNPDITLQKVAEQLSMTRDGVKKAVDKMRKSGIISREGSTKSGRWIVKE